MNKKKTLIFSIISILVVTFIYETKSIQKIIYPKKYAEYVSKYSEQFKVDENLVYSVIKAESKFDKDAVSHKSAKGLMQISEITQNWAMEEMKLGSINIFDPETNIMIGCWYLDKLNKEFENLDLVIAAYNGGSGNVSKWLKNKNYSENGLNLHSIPFEETDNYVKKVKKYYKKYSDIYKER